MKEQNANGQTTNNQQESSQQGQQETPLVETIIGIIGLLLVLATISFLLAQGSRAQEPPDIVVEATRVLQGQTNYIVEITVTNRGGQATEGLVVKGELLPKPSSSVAQEPDQQEQNQQDAPQPVESSEISFPFVPAHSSRQGGLIFRQNPQEYEIKLSASGYTVP